MNTSSLIQTEEPRVVQFQESCDNNEMQMKACFEDNYLDYKSNLDIKSKPSQNTLTTLACAVLPSVTKELIEEYCQKGVSMVIFNFYGLSYEQIRNMVAEIRKGVFVYGIKNNEVPYSMALALDLEGSHILTGTILNSTGEKSMVQLLTNEHVYVTNDAEYSDKCTKNRIYVSSNTILQLKKNDRIYLDYGRIELTVVRIDLDEVYCVIERGEILGSRISVHIPGIPIGGKLLTELDKKNIQTGIKLKVDVIMVPGIRDGAFFRRVKKFVYRNKGGDHIDLYAKIDNSMALENVDEIISTADGIFLPRPSLSMEVGFDKICLVQKNLLSKCIIAGKPTVTNGGFFRSMEHNSVPSSDEINDIINTVLDGTDCIYLDVTKRSPHQMHCIQYTSTVCRQAEAAVWEQQLFSELNKKSKAKINPAQAISIGCVEISLQCHAAAIIVITTSGLSAKLVARYRPRCPVLAIVRHGRIARKISVSRNLIAVQYLNKNEIDRSKDIQNRTKFAMNFGKKIGILNPGDLVLHLSSSEENTGFTNTMNLFYVRTEDYV